MELLSFRDGNRVDNFALRLFGLMSSLNIHGEIIDEHAIEKLLHIVPKYSQIEMLIETLLDKRSSRSRR